MPARLQVLADLSADLGFAHSIDEEIDGTLCPIHAVPLVEYRANTFSGWHAVTSCPRFDGTCAYDPDADPEQIEPPEGDGKPKTSDSRDTGGF